MTNNSKKKRLFDKCKQKGLYLTIFCDHKNRHNCVWYGGVVAEITNGYNQTIIIEAVGDVICSLFGRNKDGSDYEKCYVKDRNNHGVFFEEMHSFIKNDKHLFELEEKGSLVFENNNWFECNGIINDTFIDMNTTNKILDDDLYDAIECVIDNYAGLLTDAFAMITEESHNYEQLH